jgi:hypothetical protein
MGQKGGGNENASMSAALISSTNARAAEYDASTAALNDGRSYSSLARGWDSISAAGKGWSDAISRIQSLKPENLTMEQLIAKFPPK